MCIIKEPLAVYRVSRNSLTNKSIEHWANDRLYTLNQIILKHPESFEKFKDEFRVGFARAKYYKVRYYIQKNERVNALKELRSIIFVDYRYFILYLTLLLIPKLFNLIIYKYSKRGNSA